jgi:hypothetical protein
LHDSAIRRFIGCTFFLLFIAGGAAAQTRQWFVDNARPNGDGSSGAPFATIAAASAASASGDAIVIRRGARPYFEAVVLKEKQSLVAEGSEATPPPAADARPIIDVPEGDAVTLASGVSVQGLIIRSASGRALVLPAVKGTITVSRSAIETTSGSACAIEGGDAAIRFDTTPLRAVSGSALRASNRIGGSMTFQNGSPLEVSAGKSDGIVLEKSAGAIRIETVTITGGVRGLVAADLTDAFHVGAGTISGTSARGISVLRAANVSVANVTLRGNATANASKGTDCGRVSGAEAPRCNAAIWFTASTLALENVVVDGSGQAGIFGDEVRGLTMKNVQIGGAGDESGEHGLQLRHLSGAVVIDGCRFRESAARQLAISTASESRARIEIRRSDFAGMKKAPFAQQGAVIETAEKGELEIVVDETIFRDHLSNALHVIAAGEATVNVAVTRSKFSRNAGAIVLVASRAVGLRFRIADNQVTESRAAAINIHADTTGGVVTGSITGNTVGVSGKPGSGARCGTCHGISLNTLRGGLMDVTVENNTIQQVDGAGLSAGARGVAELRLIAKRNTIREPFGDAPASAILLDVGVLPEDSPRVCADLEANVIRGNWDPTGERAGVLVAVTGGSRIGFAGYSGSATDAAAAARQLSSRNGGVAVKIFPADPAAPSLTSATTCRR